MAWLRPYYQYANRVAKDGGLNIIKDAFRGTIEANGFAADVEGSRSSNVPKLYRNNGVNP